MVKSGMIFPDIATRCFRGAFVVGCWQHAYSVEVSTASFNFLQY